MRHFILAGIALAGTALPSPAALPAARAITTGDRATGAKAHPELLKEFGGLYEGRQAAYVTRVGQRIALQSGLSNAQSDFKISLLNSPVSNAFAIPGGYVYITRQLVALMNSEAELASVMGHEIGHVAARHAQQRQRRATYGGIGTVLGAVLGGVLLGDSGTRLGQQVAGGLAQRYVLGFSRSQEYEADDLGVSYLGRGGYDPLAASTMLASLARQTALEARVGGKEAKALPEWASTHPDPASRVTRAAQRGRAAARAATRADRDVFLDAIDGMLYDDDPAQGVIDGRQFRHPGLRLSFAAPTGFALSNSPEAVTISGTTGQAQFSQAAFGGDLRRHVASIFQAIGGGGLSVGEISTREINGLPAASASARASTRSGPVIVTVIAYQFGPSSAYHFIAIERQGNVGQFGALFNSMRRLSAQEAAAIRPRVVDVVEVKPGDTIATLSARMAYQDFREDRFRVLNALPANATLRPGQRVKLIVRS